MQNFRLILQKKEPFQVKKTALQTEIKEVLQLNDVHLKAIYQGYDLFQIEQEQFEKLSNQILIDQVMDNVIETEHLTSDHYIAIEPLPGQFDARANSALQCLQLISKDVSNVAITTSTIYVFESPLSQMQREQLQGYLLNPVEARLKDLSVPLALPTVRTPELVAHLAGFLTFSKEDLQSYKEQEGLAMSLEDLMFIQDYFREDEQREPTETEIKVLDTYWSDHCRHTTFFTEIKEVTFDDGEVASAVKEAYHAYQATRESVYGERLTQKPVCLMDLATLAAKDLKKKGVLTTVEESEEINACSVYTKVKTKDGEEDWLLMFKNETHNHPTEIEPYGGASTCLGGCIRDPLSGRAYVYQAMRLSGAANVLEPVSETLEGKLPQKKITQEAAHGFASYGNQIGLATTQVSEVYHPGYQAKRMEVGAVVAAAPADWVRRESPNPGDIIVLLGGKTGRDGVGGATGSSKEHTEESLETAGAEVQKGNPPEERKIQRLFRNGDVTKLIKKCNDFGAGGVSVAIGELADGLDVDLNVVPTKYTGLNGTELALSESQERMAVVIEAKDKAIFQAFADKENLEATHVATVTDKNRLQMKWNNQLVVDLDRTFLDTNGVRQQAKVHVSEPHMACPFRVEPTGTIQDNLLTTLRQLNVASQQGLAENFDSTIGSSTVQMPFGGQYQLTPSEGSLQTFPVLHGETSTASAMTWGFDPEISSWSPFHGGSYAVVQSMAKIVSLGANPKDVHYTFQEYFRKLGDDAKNWGLPFSALLGAYEAQQAFQCGAIGGKDSMSGTFNDIHVPPTLISFAVAALDAEQSISNELKSKKSKLYLLNHQPTPSFSPNFEQLNRNFKTLHQLIQDGKILSAGSVGKGGILPSLVKMAFGNKIGFRLDYTENLFSIHYGSILIESNEELEHEHLILIGETNESSEFKINQETISIQEALTTWKTPLEPIFKTETKSIDLVMPSIDFETKSFSPIGFGKPNVFIPAFPGTNCEYDSQKAFEQAGAKTTISVFRNLTDQSVEESILEFEKQILNTQILMLSGGFSAGDEPDGSGKFITAVLQNERIQNAIQNLLNRDGLILGICNGFQALVKSGLLPFGELQQKQAHFPTLAENQIGRHISQIVRTKIASINSPWLSNYRVGDVHQIAISHGEGRFYATEQMVKELALNGQIATQYVDMQGKPTMDRPFNPNGSMYAIEGITSKDGKVFGKMGHSERKGASLYKNVSGEVGQDIFKNGVEYFL